ncbi:MAG: GxxExxY protein [bacterium]
MDKVLYKDLSYQINGLLFKTHRELGHYKNEKQYSDYFESLLKNNDIKYIREYRFDDQRYGQGIVRCICDFIIDDKIILEFKAKEFITKEDYYQIKRYLVTLDLALGIIINFRQHRVVPKRVLNSNNYNHPKSNLDNSNL